MPERVIKHVESKCQYDEKWLSTGEAMKKLKIKSKTTLQKLRDEESIRFIQPAKRCIVYDADSIDEYLQRHARKIFR